MASILPKGKTGFTDLNGRPLIGGKVYFYEPSTENKKDTWQDEAMTIPNTNPVVLDARGEAVIWGGGSYRQVLKDAQGVTIWDQPVVDATEGISESIDDLQAGLAKVYTDLAAPTGATLIGSKGGTVQKMAGIEVDNLDDLASLPVANLLAGDLVHTRKENLTLVVLANTATNVPLDFSDVGGGKFTFQDGITRFFSAATKTVAYNRAQADSMSTDFSTMVGYAASGGTTGGGSGTIYWVTNTSDDILVSGSLRWCIEQVRTAGSGRVLFHPRGNFDVFLNSQIIMPSNITVDAPGRNARVWAPTDVTRFKLINSTNVIVRRLQFSSVPGATVTLRDGIWITPDTVDKVWIDQCSFRYAGDGCIDMSTLVEMPSGCRITVSRCLIRQHDKGMLLGSLACYNPSPPAWCPTAAPDAVKLFVTMYQNYFDSVGQRQPKVVSQTFVDSVNNVHRISEQLRDDGTTGAAYGILTATGGAAISRGDYFMSAKGTGWSGVDAVRTAQVPLGGGTGATDGPGVVDYTSATVAADGITLASFQPEKIPAISYTLNPTAIPSTSYARRKFAQTIRANAGAEFDSAADGEFRWDSTSQDSPNAFDVISETSGAGRWKRTDRMNEAPAFAALTPASRTVTTPRAPTQTIASDAITIPDTGTYFAVDTEGAASSDSLSTINNGSDGRQIVLRSASSSRLVTLVSGGNIAVPDNYPLSSNNTAVSLIYDSATSRWLLTNKLVTYSSAWNGALPFKLGAYYLWVDSSGRLRIKNSAPSTDTDGTVVGTQS
ncbi:hypothetical protein IAG25_35625 [Caballeronia sp. EK]|uniref:pectate lyase family protein n=1 Tax=Caballeronia sp. EK TaxID=2767469 RepID=UPI001655D457|nr:hypothetical protein [Caballeronia sp. EK]MBC8642138.1 hypothetical protein [Caballeronia sp. EK]